MATKKTSNPPKGQTGKKQEESNVGIPNKVLKTINEQFSPTVVEGYTPNPNDGVAKAAFFDNYVFQPNKSLPEEKLLLTGNNLTIPLQISLLEALIYLQDIDLEQWVEAWNSRYEMFSPPEISNYKIKQEDAESIKKIKIAPWKQKGLTPGAKGMIDSIKPQDFHIVEVWPDKKDEKTSFLLSGKKRDIINQIMLIANIKGGGDGLAEFDEGLNFARKGQPTIVLIFTENGEDVEDGFQPVSARISFRLMKFTDNPDRADPTLNANPLELIKDTDLNRWGTRIAQYLYPGNTPYKYRKGKEKFCYHDWANGFSSWYPVRDKQDGVDLVKALLNIMELTYKPEYAKHTVSEDPAVTYPVMPKKVTPNFGQFKGQEIYLPRRYPIADVYFRTAYLLLPTFRNKKIILFSNGSRTQF